MKIFNYFRSIYFINALLFFIMYSSRSMGYTISSQVFFTQNYENVSEIYEDLKNVQHYEK